MVHKFIPMQHAVKILDAKAAMEKEWKKLETIEAWQLEEAKSKKEDILEAQRDKSKVNFAALMDLCHPKNAQLEPKFQQFKGRVVLRVDMVKDDSEAYAVFTEQGLSAWQVTTAKVMDVIAILPDCERTSSWRSTSTHSGKNKDAHILVRLPKSACPDIWIRIPRHR